MASQHSVKSQMSVYSLKLCILFQNTYKTCFFLKAASNGNSYYKAFSFDRNNISDWLFSPFMTNELLLALRSMWEGLLHQPSGVMYVN